MDEIIRSNGWDIYPQLWDKSLKELEDSYHQGEE